MRYMGLWRRHHGPHRLGDDQARMRSYPRVVFHHSLNYLLLYQRRSWSKRGKRWSILNLCLVLGRAQEVLAHKRDGVIHILLPLDFSHAANTLEVGPHEASILGFALVIFAHCIVIFGFFLDILNDIELVLQVDVPFG